MILKSVQKHGAAAEQTGQPAGELPLHMVRWKSGRNWSTVSMTTSVGRCGAAWAAAGRTRGERRDDERGRGGSQEIRAGHGEGMYPEARGLSSMPCQFRAPGNPTGFPRGGDVAPHRHAAIADSGSRSMSGTCAPGAG
jgi:hypothetical protein